MISAARLAYIVRQAAQRIQIEQQCEYCSPGKKGCSICNPKIAGPGNPTLRPARRSSTHSIASVG